MDIIRVIVTSLTSVLVLFLFAKLIGNKQMSQLNMFDALTVYDKIVSKPTNDIFQ